MWCWHSFKHNTALMLISTIEIHLKYSSVLALEQLQPIVTSSEEVTKELASFHHKSLISSHTNDHYKKSFSVSHSSKTMTWTFWYHPCKTCPENKKHEELLIIKMHNIDISQSLEWHWTCKILHSWEENLNFTQSAAHTQFYIWESWLLTHLFEICTALIRSKWQTL
jgi:hypothetical protein